MVGQARAGAIGTPAFGILESLILEPPIRSLDAVSFGSRCGQLGSKIAVAAAFTQGFSPAHQRNSVGLPCTRAGTSHFGYGAPGFIGGSSQPSTISCSLMSGGIAAANSTVPSSFRISSRPL